MSHPAAQMITGGRPSATATTPFHPEGGALAD